MGIFFKYVLPVLSIVIVLVIPFVYVLYTGRFRRGVGLTWLLLIVWSVILSIPVYNILWNTHKELCIETLPEGNSVVAATLMGWFYGLIISGFAMLIRKMTSKFRPSLLEKETSN